MQLSSPTPTSFNDLSWVEPLKALEYLPTNSDTTVAGMIDARAVSGSAWPTFHTGTVRKREQGNPKRKKPDDLNGHDGIVYNGIEKTNP